MHNHNNRTYPQMMCKAADMNEKMTHKEACIFLVFFSSFLITLMFGLMNACFVSFMGMITAMTLPTIKEKFKKAVIKND